MPQQQPAAAPEEFRKVRRVGFVFRGERRAMNGGLLRLDVEFRWVEARVAAVDRR